jgi:hypothetical protein
LIGLVLASNQSITAQAERINWFFKSNGENCRPEILGGSNLARDWGALYLAPEGDKTVYLTFDAGYSNENVMRILDILKEENVAVMCAYMMMHFIATEGDPLYFLKEF